MRKSVVLPEPLGPTRPTFSLGFSWNEASTKRTWRPYCLLMLRERDHLGWYSGYVVFVSDVNFPAYFFKSAGQFRMTVIGDDPASVDIFSRKRCPSPETA